MRKPYCCFDCNEEDPHYMVHPQVWLQAFPNYMEVKRQAKQDYPDSALKFILLCLTCLERRVGRRLIREDFANVPINTGVMKAFDLGLDITSRETHDFIWKINKEFLQQFRLERMKNAKAV